MVHPIELVTNIIEKIKKAKNLVELDNIRIKYLGKKGHLTLQTINLNKLSLKERITMGFSINEAIKQVKQAINLRKAELEVIMLNARTTEKTIDISLPGRRIENGGLHPITRTIDRVENFFSELGFTLETGLEVEDDYHNFDALNIPAHHPSRANNNTFWFDETRLLRTQTSCVQIRIMKNQHPPIRIITSGRVYRSDYSQTHTPMFHQMEGLIVDKNITFTNLKWILNNFLHEFFEEEKLKIYFRPSYFPFTEPSAEIDVISKNGKRLEIIGCGMVHPNVLNNVGINPEMYSGFAFGMGIERLTMLRYGISDLREFFENDLRFLKQFK